MGSNIYCVIPARGGSKRIPRKNILNFQGKPMISYPITAAIKTGKFKAVAVSTDDNEIADISIKYGASVPRLRSSELANDSASTLAVMQDAIKMLGISISSDDAVMCLYPTSILVDDLDLIDGIDIFENNHKTHLLITLMEYSHPIERAYIQDGPYFSPQNPELMPIRTQEFSKKWHDAGQFYIARASQWMLPSGPKFPYIGKFFPSHKTTDIDTPEDLERAEVLFRLRNI